MLTLRIIQNPQLQNAELLPVKGYGTYSYLTALRFLLLLVVSMNKVIFCFDPLKNFANVYPILL
jgi:hypothetical protein